MIVEDKEYSVAYEQAERVVRFTGLLRLRSPRDYGPILELLRGAHAEKEAERRLRRPGRRRPDPLS